ncbi:11007_t:CDS:2, partial [Funneliformis mosseae]
IEKLWISYEIRPQYLAYSHRTGKLWPVYEIHPLVHKVNRYPDSTCLVHGPVLNNIAEKHLRKLYGDIT